MEDLDNYILCQKCQTDPCECKEPPTMQKNWVEGLQNILSQDRIKTAYTDEIIAFIHQQIEKARAEEREKIFIEIEKLVEGGQRIITEIKNKFE